MGISRLMVPSSEGPNVATISSSLTVFPSKGSMLFLNAAMHNGRVSAIVPSRSNMTAFIMITQNKKISLPSNDMKGLMMDYQLTLPTILRRAETLFGDKAIVSCLPDRSIHRYTYRD